MITVLDIGEVSVDVVFKDIKNVHLSVYPPTGRIRISAPSRMTLDNVRLFAISKLGWIKKQRGKLLSQEREPAREFLERESHYVWGRRYLLRLEVGNPAVELGHRDMVLRADGDSPPERRRDLLEEWYRREMRMAVAPLVRKWESALDIHVSRFFIQRMKTKWGSSNPVRRTIRLNLELAKKPPECLDYIVLHEMLHFIVPNHSTRFQALLDENQPGWRHLRQVLNESPLLYN
ncbi:M48 family metallopeptidase [Mesorhizobium sp. CA12]|uniref:M48 family metallopeptidase n=1 Tax=Mesorhizobium sp. CA12 TaxID=2876644 RepID=UPI001CCD4686|nr:SprT family zinc-dependent metalloprotease [Mesorhizobium sp. CA12]MBZ9859698.1 M48 family metallopeptidase [Mesorhizobium sp. CA12]